MNVQIERIKDKLSTIKDFDKEYQVFGASSHQYGIGEVVRHTDIKHFEQEYNVELPEAYVAFLTQVGNGTNQEDAYGGSAAGPYYGIYPLGTNLIDVFVEDIKRSIAQACILDPKMTKEEWEALTLTLQEDDLSDEDYYEIQNKLFSGLLAIGTQGCAITTCLVMNGEHRGRIVYINEDFQPSFAYEEHFLDWYERWLDEIISGELVSKDAGWFGYARGGSSESLWESFKTIEDKEEKLEYLVGLSQKKEISEAILQEIEYVLSEERDDDIRSSFTMILAKVAFKRAIPFITELIGQNLLVSLKIMHWYAEDKAYWLPFITPLSDTINDEETFRFYTYVVSKATDDYGDLMLTGLQSANQAIRATAIYTLGEAKNKKEYLNQFIQCLCDDDERVVLYALQGLKEVNDERLLPCYNAVYKKYKASEEENYIIVNLEHRLKELDLSLEELER